MWLKPIHRSTIDQSEAIFWHECDWASLCDRSWDLAGAGYYGGCYSGDMLC